MGQFSCFQPTRSPYGNGHLFSINYMALIANGIVPITKSVGVKRIVSPCNDQLGKETKRIGVVTRSWLEAKSHQTVSHYVSRWVGRVHFQGPRIFLFLIWRILFPLFFMFRFPTTSNPINRLNSWGPITKKKRPANEMQMSFWLRRPEDVERESGE